MILKFIKLANRWYVHIPDYPGTTDDLEMVMGADVLCDMLDNDEDGLISVEIFTNEEDLVNRCNPLSHIYTLDFVNSTTMTNGEQDGANYRLREWKLDIWLCMVTKYVLGEFPATIYISLL